MDTGHLPARHRLDVDAYHRMGEAGILGETDRVELLDGELIDMAPIGLAHASIVGRMIRALFLACQDRAVVWPQNPVQLDRESEPLPDGAVLRPRSDFYEAGLPGPSDILLLMEVADSSLRFDETVKLPLYARAGIGEVWIVDVQGRVLHAYRGPAGDRYAEETEHHAGERLALRLAPEIVVSLDFG